MNFNEDEIRAIMDYKGPPRIVHLADALFRELQFKAAVEASVAAAGEASQEADQKSWEKYVHRELVDSPVWEGVHGKRATDLPDMVHHSPKLVLPMLGASGSLLVGGVACASQEVETVTPKVVIVTPAPTEQATEQKFDTPVAVVTADPNIELYTIVKQIEVAQGGPVSQTENLQPAGEDLMAVPAVYDASGELDIPATVKAVALENANRNIAQAENGLIPAEDVTTIYTADKVTGAQFTQALQEFPASETLAEIIRFRKFNRAGEEPTDPEDYIFARTRDNQFYWLQAIVAPESEGSQNVIQYVWTKQTTAGGEFDMYWNEATGKWDVYPTGKGAEVTATPSPEPTVDVQEQVSTMETIDAAKHPEQIAALSLPVAVEAWLQNKIDVSDPRFGLTDGSFDGQSNIINFGEAKEFLGIKDLNAYYHRYPVIILGLGENHIVYLGMKTKKNQSIVVAIDYAKTTQVGHTFNHDSGAEENVSPYTSPDNRLKFNADMENNRVGELAMIDLGTYGPTGTREDLLQSQRINAQYITTTMDSTKYNGEAIKQIDFSGTPDPKIVELIAYGSGYFLAYWNIHDPEAIKQDAVWYYNVYANAALAVDFLNGTADRMPNSISKLDDLATTPGGLYASLEIDRK